MLHYPTLPISRSEAMALRLAAFTTALLIILHFMNVSNFLQALAEMDTGKAGIAIFILFGLRLADHYTGMKAAAKLHRLDPLKYKPVLSSTFLDKSIIKFAKYFGFAGLGYIAWVVIPGLGGSVCIIYALAGCIFSEVVSLNENLSVLSKDGVGPLDWAINLFNKHILRK